MSTPKRQSVLLILGLLMMTMPLLADDSWRTVLDQEVKLLGHRNWIVIADSAYPAQSNPGIRTVVTGAQQLEVVSAALEAVRKAGHVRAVVHLDSELAHVPETGAAGIETYRKELEGILKGAETSRLPHEQIIGKLDESAKLFRVLILKTEMKLPYTSVFLLLDCGYWGPDAEKALRESMRRKN